MRSSPQMNRAPSMPAMGGGGFPPPPPGGGGGGGLRAQAIWAYTTNNPREIPFNAGDIVDVLKKDKGGWWQVMLNGRKGWVPGNYFRPL